VQSLALEVGTKGRDEVERGAKRNGKGGQTWEPSKQLAETGGEVGDGKVGRCALRVRVGFIPSSMSDFF
jgi:hypothetical protein